MGLVVTGIAQTEDTSAVQSALRAAGLPLDPLSVISGGDGTGGVADSGSGSGSIGIASMGVDVPGIGARPAAPELFRSETTSDRLSDLEIPDSELGNYEAAIERGKAVIVYYARPDNVDRVSEIFRGAGLANVQTY